MRSLGGMSNPARHLFHVELPSIIEIEGKKVVLDFSYVVVKRESRRRLVPELDLALREVDRPTIEPARCAGLESPNCKAQLSKIFAQCRAGVRHASARLGVLAYM
jgi:hypothetical protein